MFTPRTRALFALLCTPLLISANTVIQAAPWMCSVNQGTDCDVLDSDCLPPHELANVPTFLEVDLDGNEVTVLGPPHLQGVVSPILAKDGDAERVLATGIEGRRGWAMVIMRSDGTMTLTVIGQGGGFMLFGHCVERTQ